MKEVRDPKANFQKVAESKSRDPSAKSNRGDLGFLMRDQMTPEVSDIAFSAEIGKVVGPIKSAFGYHLLKIIGIEPGSLPSFEEVKNRVLSDYRASLIRDFVSGLRDKADVKVIE